VVPVLQRIHCAFAIRQVLCSSRSWWSQYSRALPTDQTPLAFLPQTRSALWQMHASLAQQRMCSNTEDRMVEFCVLVRLLPTLAWLGSYSRWWNQSGEAWWSTTDQHEER
jgi:hypothetical protein